MNSVSLRRLPPALRAPIAAFVIVAIAGYAAGLVYVYHNTGMGVSGIAAHYHGDEGEMKFGKSPAEMLGIVHTHLLGMGTLFFLIAILYALGDSNARAKVFWSTETLLSLLTTFGALWLVAVGWRWPLWLLFPSSLLMVIGFAVMSVSILCQCLMPGRTTGITAMPES